jgi:hypothetical protein
MITSPPCGHCEQNKTQPHCENPACTWITCANCRKITKIAKV